MTSGKRATNRMSGRTRIENHRRGRGKAKRQEGRRPQRSNNRREVQDMVERPHTKMTR